MSALLSASPLLTPEKYLAGEVLGAVDCDVGLAAQEGVPDGQRDAVLEARPGPDRVDEVVFSYSDLSHIEVMQKASLVLAAVGLCASWEGLVRSLRVSKEELKRDKPWLASIGGIGLVLPLFMMLLVFTAPKALISTWPGLLDVLDSVDPSYRN